MSYLFDTKNANQLLKETKTIVEMASEKPISKRNVLAASAMIRNQQRMKSMNESSFSGTSMTGAASGGDHWDSMLIKMLRRSIPEQIAFEVAGVQPLETPNGAVFAMASYFGSADAYNTNTPERSGLQSAVSTVQGNPFAADALTDAFTAAGTPTTAQTLASGMSVGVGEALGLGGASGVWNDMDLKIKRYSVDAKSRKLKTEYSIEIEQDARAVHGLDFEKEVIDILSTEITRETNNEILGKMYFMAVLGGCRDAAGAVTGCFDIVQSTSGRWANERFKGLLYQIEIEANAIAKYTRRGKGNFVVTTGNVASALAMTGLMENMIYGAPKLEVNETGNLFAGTINGMKVYIDPFLLTDGALVGYKGDSAMDAGIFYSPYQPLQMTKVSAPSTFQPAIGFSSRYAVSANPLCQALENSTDVDPASYRRKNNYFRLFRIDNLGQG